MDPDESPSINFSWAPLSEYTSDVAGPSAPQQEGKESSLDIPVRDEESANEVHTNKRRRTNPSSRLTPADWDRHKRTLVRLYMQEDHSLSQTMRIMKGRHNFRATRPQYELQFKKWDLKKRLSGNTVLWMATKAEERKAIGKATIFEFNGKTFSSEEVSRRAKRVKKTRECLDGDAEEELSMVGVGYSTPRGSADELETATGYQGIHKPSFQSYFDLSTPDKFGFQVKGDVIMENQDKDDKSGVSFGERVEDSDLATWELMRTMEALGNSLPTVKQEISHISSSVKVEFPIPKIKQEFSELKIEEQPQMARREVLDMERQERFEKQRTKARKRVEIEESIKSEISERKAKVPKLGGIPSKQDPAIVKQAAPAFELTEGPGYMAAMDQILGDFVGPTYTPTSKESVEIPRHQGRPYEDQTPVASPESISDSMECREVFGSGMVWTCTPPEELPMGDIPLRISGYPVVVPVQSSYPTSAYTVPPPDPHHGFIDASKEIDEKTLRDIFRTFENILGFYVLINGMLQLIVADDFDVEYALSHRPNEFGGLSVSYIHQSIIPTAEMQRNDTSTFQGKIGLMTEFDNQNYLVISSHILTQALVAAKSTRFPGDDWIKYLVVYASNGGREIGSVETTYDPDARNFPHGFLHDVSLVKIPATEKHLFAGMASRFSIDWSPLDWLSQAGWGAIKYTSQNLFLLDKPDLQAKSIGILVSQCQMVGQAIFKVRRLSEKRNMSRFWFWNLREESQTEAEPWTGLVSRSVLYRTDANSNAPGALSGTAVCLREYLEDSTVCAKVAGFSSWAQPVREITRFDMEGPKLYNRLHEGRVAFFGAFQAPYQLRESHRIV